MGILDTHSKPRPIIINGEIAYFESQKLVDKNQRYIEVKEYYLARDANGNFIPGKVSAVLYERGGILNQTRGLPYPIYYKGSVQGAQPQLSATIFYETGNKKADYFVLPSSPTGGTIKKSEYTKPVTCFLSKKREYFDTSKSEIARTIYYRPLYDPKNPSVCYKFLGEIHDDTLGPKTVVSWFDENESNIIDQNQYYNIISENESALKGAISQNQPPRNQPPRNQSTEYEDDGGDDTDGDIVTEDTEDDVVIPEPKEPIYKSDFDYSTFKNKKQVYFIANGNKKKTTKPLTWSQFDSAIKAIGVCNDDDDEDDTDVIFVLTLKEYIEHNAKELSHYLKDYTGVIAFYVKKKNISKFIDYNRTDDNILESITRELKNIFSS